MAHAAVISLKQTLNRLLNSSPTPEILQLAYNHTTILQQALERFSGRSSSSKRLDVLEGEIRDCAHKLHDILDFHGCESSELESEIASFTTRAAEMAAAYIEQLLTQPVDDDDTASSNVDSNVKMVGRSSKLADIKWYLTQKMRPDETCLFYIVGEAGTGRTIVAKTVFDDLMGDDRFFDCGAWAAIGATYEVKEVVINIISQVVDENRRSEYMLLEEEQKLRDFMYRMLEHRRYLIVLDDVHDLQILHRLVPSLPEQRNGSAVLVTTSNPVEVGVFAGGEERIHVMPTAKNEQSSWVGLRMEMFGEAPISPEFEELGKKIAENCGGRRISLAKTLLYLSKTEKTVEEWRKIATDKENPIFMVGDEILEKREIEKELQSYTNVQDEDEDDSFIYLISTWLNFTDHIQNIMMKMRPKWCFSKITEYFYGVVGIRKSTLVKEAIKDQVQEEDDDEDGDGDGDGDEDEDVDVDGDVDLDSLNDLISKWLNFSDHIQGVKRKMHPKRFFPKMQIISFHGMAGIGKSAIVKEVLKDHSVVCPFFDYCVWVTLGPKYRAEEILIDILAQIYRNFDRKHMKEDEALVMDLCAQLSQKKGIIVLDDIWSKEPLHHLKKIFPDIKGIAFVTTRLAKVAKFDIDDIVEKMEFLNKEESWCLLRQQVFGEEGFCSFELETAGRKIAQNCEGLPLLIIKVSDQLSKGEKTVEFWNNVALGKQDNSVFMNANNEISKALRPSYMMLPQHLKSCFLYLGLFRKGYEIPMSKLTNLWIAEGFLEPNTTRTIKDFVLECLYELVNSSLVMDKLSVSFSKIKTCRLHTVFWHLCKVEAAKNGFFHAINSYDDCSIESINNLRRLCIRNNSLLGMQFVHNSIASITSAHSLLCVGPPHQYQVPINLNLRLLRVMDALTIRLYEFPAEVVKLVHLRYLGLTCNGKLPTSISKVRKLQHLIVRRYINTKSSCEDYSLLPLEIWDMQELEHLQIMGGCLLNPKSGAGLPKLSTLLDVSAQCCSKKVLKRIPNLKRLGIRIELPPNGKGSPFRCLNRIARLRRLESLKCVVVNPQIGINGVAPHSPISMFPPSLKTLSLSGLGYPWEHMSIIGQLENLEVLKLKGYAFRGSKWIAGRWDIEYPCEFENLKFLLIEDTDLMHWEIKTPIFQCLQRMSIKHCYKLRELPTYLPISCFSNIEIVDCNPLVVKWAQEMKIRPARFVIGHHLSWLAPQ